MAYSFREVRFRSDRDIGQVLQCQRGPRRPFRTGPAEGSLLPYRGSGDGHA